MLKQYFQSLMEVDQLVIEKHEIYWPKYQMHFPRFALPWRDGMRKCALLYPDSHVKKVSLCVGAMEMRHLPQKHMEVGDYYFQPLHLLANQQYYLQ